MMKLATNRKPGAPEQLALQIKAALAQPPVRADMRLLPERELGARFEGGVTNVHRALELLAGEGILSKRHGSGNYVRKIPLSAPELPLRVPAPEELFPESELRGEAAARLTSLPEGRCLHLQLWSGFHRAGSENAGILQEIRRTVEAAGHRLELCSVFNEEGEATSDAEVCAQLRQGRADGYLVSAPRGKQFQRCYHEVYGQAPSPAVFLSLWDGLPDLEPIIRLDGLDSVLRGIGLFASSGLQRIALLGVERRDSGLPDNLDAQFYEFAMHYHGLSYRNVHLASFDRTQAYQQTRRLLASAPLPEAVFVTDDHFLQEVEEALHERGLVLGRDIAGISISNRRDGLQPVHDWTSIEYDRTLLGSYSANALIRALTVAGAPIHSLSLPGRWRFRASHNRASSPA